MCISYRYRRCPWSFLGRSHVLAVVATSNVAQHSYTAQLNFNVYTFTPLAYYNIDTVVCSENLFWAGAGRMRFPHKHLARPTPNQPLCALREDLRVLLLFRATHVLSDHNHRPLFIVSCRFPFLRTLYYFDPVVPSNSVLHYHGGT